MSFWEFVGAVGASLVSGVGAVILLAVAMAVVLLVAIILTARLVSGGVWHWAWNLIAVPAIWAVAIFILLVLAWLVSFVYMGAAAS